MSQTLTRDAAYALLTEHLHYSPASANVYLADAAMGGAFPTGEVRSITMNRADGYRITLRKQVQEPAEPLYILPDYAPDIYG